MNKKIQIGEYFFNKILTQLINLIYIFITLINILLFIMEFEIISEIVKESVYKFLTLDYNVDLHTLYNKKVNLKQFTI